MHCRACDELLTDKENSRKYSSTGEYIELCDNCLRGTGIAYTESLYRDELDRIDEDREQNSRNLDT